MKQAPYTPSNMNKGPKTAQDLDLIIDYLNQQQRSAIQPVQ